MLREEPRHPIREGERLLGRVLSQVPLYSLPQDSLRVMEGSIDVFLGMYLNMFVEVPIQLNLQSAL